VASRSPAPYNLSERDGKKLAGGITIFGGVAPAVIYNNMIYYEPDRLAGSVMFNGEGGAVTSSIFGKSGRPEARFYNNILLTNFVRTERVGSVGRPRHRCGGFVGQRGMLNRRCWTTRTGENRALTESAALGQKMRHTPESVAEQG